MPIYVSASSGPTLTELRAGLRNKGYDGSPDTLIDIAVNAAYLDILGKRRWSWLSASTTLQTTPGDPEVDLSGVADLAHVDAVRLRIGTEAEEIEWWPAQKLHDELHLDAASPREWPQAWTLENGKLVFYPTPDRAYTVTVQYTKAVEPLSAPTDRALLPYSYRDLIEWRAAMEPAARQRDWTMGQTAAQMFTQRLGDLARADARGQRQTSEQVRSGYWNQAAL